MLSISGDGHKLRGTDTVKKWAQCITITNRLWWNWTGTTQEETWTSRRYTCTKLEQSEKNLNADFVVMTYKKQRTTSSLNVKILRGEESNYFSLIHKNESHLQRIPDSQLTVTDKRNHSMPHKIMEDIQ